ncbi:MAG: tRNA lysidine(34) synthetase TilS [Clostridia bacterium]|nr:tRNA lysidine(34) synthetase TilS [Clostridia bacterium]
MLENAKQLIEQYAMGKSVAAAVSGGEDSMALLHVLLPYAQQKKMSLCVVHVDHCLRKNSADDCAFVQDFCNKNGVAFRGVRINVPALCARSGRGAECEAHFARRDVFAALQRSGACDLVATAHHARDNAETVLLHLFRGCGLAGLSGMRVLSDDGLFRPFLTTPKEEITAYVSAHSIPFVTDATNADTVYDRNYIRHIVLPAVRSRFPAAEQAICRTAAIAAEAQAQTEATLCDHAIGEKDGAVLLREDFVTAPYIFAALKRLGQKADVYQTAVASVQRLAAGKPCARADIGNGIVAAREYGAIAFYRPAATQNARAPFEVPRGDALRIHVGRGATVAVQSCPPAYPAPKGVLYIDADKVPVGSVWRTRREGDVFAPFGSGRKKLKEYLIDKKVPRRLRDGIALLCCGNEVLAAAGLEISRAVQTDEDSRCVLCIRVLKEESESCDA